MLPFLLRPPFLPFRLSVPFFALLSFSIGVKRERTETKDGEEKTAQKRVLNAAVQRREVAAAEMEKLPHRNGTQHAKKGRNENGNLKAN